MSPLNFILLSFCLRLYYSTNNCIVNLNLIKIMHKNLYIYLCNLTKGISVEMVLYNIQQVTLYNIHRYNIQLTIKKIVGYSPTILTLLISVCFSSLYSLCAFIVALIFFTLSVCSIKLLVFHINISPLTVSNLYILIIP